MNRDDIEDILSNMHTMCIAKVTSVHGETISAKPVTNRVVKGKSVELPEFSDIPVLHISGGGSSLRMPITVGDYAILIFSESNFDQWWGGNDFADPLDDAKFDYSDAIAIVGVVPGGVAIPSISTFYGDILMSANAEVSHRLTYGSIETGGSVGVSGSFTSNDGKTITVTNGIITGIV